MYEDIITAPIKGFQTPDAAYRLVSPFMILVTYFSLESPKKVTT